jgi:hypothetical protein
METRRQAFPELIDRVLEALAGEMVTGDDLVERLGDAVPGDDPVGLLEDLLDGHPWLRWCPDGYYRYDLALTGATFTTVLTADEIASGVVDAEGLPAVTLLPDVVVETSGLRVEVEGHDPRTSRMVLRGPDGWLDGLEPGCGIAVGYDGEKVRYGACGVVPEVASVPEEVVAGLRSAFDQADSGTVGVLSLHADLRSVVVEALCRDPEPWHRVLPPLADIVEAAGLSSSGDLLAEAGFDWEADRIDRAVFGARLTQRLTEAQAAGLSEVAGLLLAFQQRGEAALDGEGYADSGADGVAAAAGLLSAGRVAPALYRLARSDLAVSLADLRAFAAGVASRAGRDRYRVGPLWLAARCDLAAGRPLDAEGALRRIEATAPGYRPAIEELAWLALDRSQFDTADRLLERAGPADTDLAEIVSTLARPTVRAAGRNDPCPCGSGRKYKRCHVNRALSQPLPERAAALRQKVARVARAEVDLSGPYPPACWDGSDSENKATFNRVMADGGLLSDVMFFDGGALRHYLDVRGEVLPEDEIELAGQWLATPRTVVRVTGPLDGDGRYPATDLATGAELCIRAPAAHPDHRPGLHLVIRPLADSKGALALDQGVAVDDSDVAEVLRIVTTADGKALADRLLPAPSPEETVVISVTALDVTGVDREALDAWMAASIGVGDSTDGGATSGDSTDGGATSDNGGSGGTQVVGAEGTIAVRHEGRLTLVTWDSGARQQAMASLTEAVGPVETMDDTSVTLSTLVEEVDLLRPDLTRKDAEEGSPDQIRLLVLTRALADVGTDANPDDLAGVHMPLPGDHQS